MRQNFLDLHLIVNKIRGDQSDRLVTVVADAPVTRFGQTLDWFGGGASLQQELGKADLGIKVRCDREGHYRMELADNQAPLTDRQADVIGQTLFQILFPTGSTAYDLLGRSCQCANIRNMVLRLKLELHSDLSNLPWEIMRCPLTGAWTQDINMARRSVVRYLGDIHSPQSVPSSETGSPAVIIVKADPRDLSRHEITVSLFRERDRLVNVMQSLSDHVRYELIQEGDTLYELSSTIDELKANNHSVIGLHFMGHGGVDDDGSFFVGQNSEGNQRRIYEHDLRDALDKADSIQWAIFNACSVGNEPVGCPLAGLVTSMAVLKNIPTVIAYKRPVETTDAEALAAAFFQQVLKEGSAIENVIRSVQIKHAHPGGLVILQRSVAGRVQEFIQLGLGGMLLPQAFGVADLVALPTSLETSQAVDGEASPTQSTPPSAPPPETPRDTEMIRVPSGPFPRGLAPRQVASIIAQFKKADLPLDFDQAKELLTEEKADKATVEEYHIAKTLVTNAQFARFVDETGYRTDAEKAGDAQNWRVNDTSDLVNHPVVHVSYNDAKTYCQWAGMRLPTADEWKKAYRSEQGNIYPWGDTFSAKKCNTAESCRGFETTPVTMFPQGTSSYGCLDMVGNVEEWTQTTDRNSRRIILGGSWSMTCQVYGLPVLHRLASDSFYSNDLGFRCVRQPR